MRSKDLVRMLNQIAAFHGGYPREEAVAAVAKHVADFWDPRMRAALASHLARGGEGLSDLARAGAERAVGAAETAAA